MGNKKYVDIGPGKEKLFNFLCSLAEALKLER